MKEIKSSVIKEILREVASDISDQYTQRKEQHEINKLVNAEIYPQVSRIKKYLLLIITGILVCACFTDPAIMLLVVPILIGAAIIKEDIKVKKREEIMRRYRSGKYNRESSEWWD